jgi:parallel beta helix pectate lyase-like protein/List-Bact-rpt repeat protein
MAGPFRISVVVILLVAGALLLAALAQAAPLRTFYVDPAGDDSATGAITAPWRTLQKAANTVRAGDLVIVRAGHYAGLYLTTSGTASDPITFRGEPGAIVDAPNPTTPDGINLEGASYVVIENFTVTGVPRAGIRSVMNHHVTIRGNAGDLNGRWGILTGFSDDLLIENNSMSRSQAEHGIYVGNSGDRPVIRRNHVWGNNANGIHMNGDLSQGGDGIISGAVVEGNIIHDNGVAGGSGINCDGVQSSIIRNNLLYNNHASGISLYQIDGGQPARNNQILNNTIIEASDARWAINIQNASTGNVVRNNILYNLHSFRGSIDISSDSLPGFVSDANVVMDRLSIDGTRVTLAAWRSTTGQDSHSIIATPAVLFANFAGNDYHLSATSPARDAGATVADVKEDLEGAPRPQGPAYDIGAYEFPASTAPVTLTVTRTGNGAVTSAPAGITCGIVCSAPFTAGTSVTLTAAPAAGSVFTGWSGGGCSGSGPCTVALATATTVGAAFAPAPVALTVVRAGLGAGSVTSAPAGITCGTTCSATFTSGSSVVLTATAAGGSVFSGWSGGGCSGTGTCSVTTMSATTITATFASATTTFPLGVTVSGSGTGTVTSAPAGLACSTVCSASFASGTSVVLTATAGAGSVFAGWSGGCSGNGSCTVVLDQARTATARFRRVFTDATLTPGSSVVRAAHFTELRGAIDTLRARQGLAAFGWTDPSLVAGATAIKQIHLGELRSAVAAVYAARGLTAPAWTDATISPRAALVRAVHITELRSAVLALE